MSAHLLVASVEITSNPILPSGKAETPYSFQFTSNAPLSSEWKNFTTLPSGLFITSTGLLLGTALVGGAFSFQIAVSQLDGSSATQIVTLQIASQLVLVNPNIQEGAIGQPFYLPTVQGGSPPYQWKVTAGSLPPGLSLSPNGTVLGTYTTVGVYSFTLTVTDSTGASLVVPVTQTVISSYAQLTGNTPTLRPGLAYNFQLAITGGVPPFRFLTTQFCGMSLSALGEVSGTADNCGTFLPLVFLDATGLLTDTSIYVLNSEIGTAVSGNTLTATVQRPFNFDLPQPSGNPPFSWTGQVPANVQLDSTAGILSGQIDSPGTSVFSITSTNGSGQQVVTTYTLATASNALEILTSSLDPVVLGQTDSILVQLSGAVGTPQVFLTASGDNGLLFQSTSRGVNGAIDFPVPASLAPGLYPITILVTDGGGNQAQRTLPLTILSSGLNLGELTLPALNTSTPQATRLQAFGGVPPYQFSVPYPAALPPGITIDSSGNLSGAPTIPGVYNFAVAVTDGAQNTVSKVYQITVFGPYNALNSVPSALVGIPYSAPLISPLAPANPYSVQITGPVPTGFTVDSNGNLSGLPVAPGSYDFTETATASNGETTRQDVTLIIGPNPALPARTLPDAKVGVPYSQILPTTLSGSVAWTAGPESLPSGLTFDPTTGVVSGTPTQVGQFGLVAAANSTGPADAAVYSFYVVTASTLTIFPSVVPPLTQPELPIRLSAIGGVPPYTFSIPSSASQVSPEGILVAEPFPFTVQVIDSEGHTGTITYDPVNGALPEFTPPPSPLQGMVGTPFFYQLLLSGVSQPASYSQIQVPGLFINQNGAVVGTPQQAGTFTVTGSATPSYGNTTAYIAFTVAIQPKPLSVATSALAAAHPGFRYQTALVASGGVPPYSWNVPAASLPAGLQINSTGILFGIPSSSRLSQLPVTVQDSTGAIATANMALLVDPSVPAIDSGGIANAGSYANQAIAPAEIVAIFGASLGPQTLLSSSLVNGAFPTQLAGTQIFFDGIPAPLLYVQNSQAAAVVPSSIGGKQSVNVVIVRNGVSSASAYVPVSSVVPGILTLDASGSGEAAALNQDLTLNSHSNPAFPGSVVVLFATGTGMTSPSVPDGDLAPASQPLPALLTALGVVIGGEPAQVVYAGVAPGEIYGLTQINVELPQNLPAGRLPVVITQLYQATVIQTQSTAFIEVQ